MDKNQDWDMNFWPLSQAPEFGDKNGCEFAWPKHIMKVYAKFGWNPSSGGGGVTIKNLYQVVTFWCKSQASRGQR